MKLTVELIEAYLDGSLESREAAKLKLWLKEHPADQAQVLRQSRLRDLLASSAMEPSAAQSRKMWANIKAQVKAGAASTPVLDFSEPWYAFIFKPWGSGLSAGLATAALLVFAFVWHPWQAAPLVQEQDFAPAATEAVSAKAEEQPVKEVARFEAAKADRSSAGAKAKKSVATADDAGFAPSMEMASAGASASAAPRMAARAAAAPAMKAEAESLASSEPSEVERALADSDFEGMIDAQLAQVRRTPSRSSASVAGGRGLGTVGFSGYGAAEESVADSKALTAVQGRPDGNGFWDWRPAAMAINRRDWLQVKVELNAARANAAEAVERSFAGSALTLLSAPGAPLAGQGQALPGTGELRVLGAGRWQLISDSRMARFSEGVSARLPGFRSEGDSLLLDLTFDRGTFSPGTRFTRVAGDAPAEVLDAQGVAVSADEFSAPTGATYNVSGRQLKLR